MGKHLCTLAKLEWQHIVFHAHKTFERGVNLGTQTNASSLQTTPRAAKSTMRDMLSTELRSLVSGAKRLHSNPTRFHISSQQDSLPDIVHKVKQETLAGIQDKLKKPIKEFDDYTFVSEVMQLVFPMGSRSSAERSQSPGRLASIKSQPTIRFNN